MNTHLPVMCESAQKGDKAVIFTMSNAASPVNRIFQRKNLLQYSYKNDTDSQKNVFAIAYDRRGKMIWQSVLAVVAPNTVYHGKLILPSDEVCGTVSIYDGNITSFSLTETASPAEREQGNTGGGHVISDPFSERYNEYIEKEKAKESNQNTLSDINYSDFAGYRR